MHLKMLLAPKDGKNNAIRPFLKLVHYYDGFLIGHSSAALRSGYRAAHCDLSAVRGVDCSQEANFLDWWLDLCDHILSS